MNSNDIKDSRNIQIDFIITYPDGTIEKIPSDNYQRITITPVVEDNEESF